MYQWRKFEFFEEKYGGKCRIPNEVTGTIRCCSSGRGKVVIGCDDGSVSLLDRGLKFNFGFLAHSSTILFLQQLKQRNFLVTVGEDEQVSPPKSAVFLKVFDLDKTQEEGTSSTTPNCIGILRIFTNQFPESKIASFLVLEETPPILLIAIGLENGRIYCIKGDIARERISRFKLQVDDAAPETNMPVTGLGFRVDGPALYLFASTPSSVSLFSLHNQPPKHQLLDHVGSGFNSTATSDSSEFIIGRPEAIYFYDIDGRGPCWAFDGEKKCLGWFRGYLLCVTTDQQTDKDVFNIYDLKNRLIAHNLAMSRASHLLCEWGTVFLLTEDKTCFCFAERDMESKLGMLFKKNLYTVAVNIVQSHHADAAATAEVLRKYGDHLYGKQEYDESMAQYIHTIGHLEPSYVIQKFLDAQRVYNLTNYLEKLHERGLASMDHTTLLLNCYTKLKDVEKLDLFIKSDDSEHKFDVETAIRVCRAANYHEHAMYVAKKAAKHKWYLKILLEDLCRYDEALGYISGLDLSHAGLTLKQYGKILVNHKPRETIRILLRVCTENEETKRIDTFHGENLSLLPSPMDFLNVFIHHPRYLMEFLELYTAKVKDSPSQIEIHNTLLELYLTHDLSFPSMSQIQSDEACNTGTDLFYETGDQGIRPPSLPREGSDKVLSPSLSHGDKKETRERHAKGLQLLEQAWMPGLEHPFYDVDLAIILCEMNGFKDGLLFLYEKLKLYKEVITCYMQARDHSGLIACCKRLGDPRKGGDPSLWTAALNYFGSLGEDCSEEVKEVVAHIEKDDILPPIIVLQTLSRNPCLTLSVIKDYIARNLERESKIIEEDCKAIEKYQEDTSAMRREIADLRTNARIFQLSKCTACTFTLDLPAVHFMCMHSFHQRCLGDNEAECPVCAPGHRSVLELKKSLERNSGDQERFFQEVKNSKDGFSVIAEYFGKGIISKTSDREYGGADLDTAWSGNEL